MRHPAGETVTVTREGGPTGEFDEMGNEIISSDVSFTVSDVAVAPAGPEEDPRNIGLWVITGYTLYMPYNTVLRPTDRITVRGVSGWQVVGDTEASGWRNPFNGLTPGSVVSVKRSV